MCCAVGSFLGLISLRSANVYYSIYLSFSTAVFLILMNISNSFNAIVGTLKNFHILCIFNFPSNEESEGITHLFEIFDHMFFWFRLAFDTVATVLALSCVLLQKPVLFLLRGFVWVCSINFVLDTSVLLIRSFLIWGGRQKHFSPNALIGPLGVIVNLALPCLGWIVFGLLCMSFKSYYEVVDEGGTGKEFATAKQIRQGKMPGTHEICGTATKAEEFRQIIENEQTPLLASSSSITTEWNVPKFTTPIVLMAPTSAGLSSRRSTNPFDPTNSPQDDSTTKPFSAATFNSSTANTAIVSPVSYNPFSPR